MILRVYLGFDMKLLNKTSYPESNYKYDDNLILL